MKKASRIFTVLVVLALAVMAFTACDSITGGDSRVKSVGLSSSNGTYKVGDTHELVATVYPLSAVNRNVSWSSSDDSVASVSNTGLVTALAIGEATITVTTADGGFTNTHLAKVVKAFADGGASKYPVNIDNDGVMTLDTVYNVEYNGGDEYYRMTNKHSIPKAKRFSFTPTETGKYVFRTTRHMLVGGRIYVYEGETLDDSACIGYEEVKSLEYTHEAYELTAGKTYYFYFCVEYAVGAATFHIQKQQSIDTLIERLSTAEGQEYADLACDYLYMVLEHGTNAQNQQLVDLFNASIKQKLRDLAEDGIFNGFSTLYFYAMASSSSALYNLDVGAFKTEVETNGDYNAFYALWTLSTYIENVSEIIANMDLTALKEVSEGDTIYSIYSMSVIWEMAEEDNESASDILKNLDVTNLRVMAEKEASVYTSSIDNLVRCGNEEALSALTELAEIGKGEAISCLYYYAVNNEEEDILQMILNLPVEKLSEVAENGEYGLLIQLYESGSESVFELFSENEKAYTGLLNSSYNNIFGDAIEIVYNFSQVHDDAAAKAALANFSGRKLDELIMHIQKGYFDTIVNIYYLSVCGNETATDTLANLGEYMMKGLTERSEDGDKKMKMVLDYVLTLVE